MSDTEFDIDTSKLTPANQNPWYILMTLYGEQEGDEIDWELHAKNCEAWNLWACQYMPEEEIKDYERIFRPNPLTKFHLQNHVTDIKRRYLQIWKERNGEHAAPDEIPSPKNSINLDYIYVSNIISCLYMIFPKSISIQGSYFGKLTTFSRSIFVGRFNSDSAFFNSTISFDVSEFRKAVFLRKCTFKDDSYFRNITACDAFVATDSSFHGDTFFYLASFSDLTMFDYSIFNDSVRFRGAKFHDTAGFRCAIFNCRKDYTIISFEECIFYKALSFEDAFFKEYFPIFTGSIFLGIVIFSSLDHRWPREMCKSIDNAKATSAIVRHLLAKQGSPEDAHFFFRREMYFAGQIGSTVQRLPYLIYGWLSDYGYSIKRPAIGLGLVWLFGTAILDTAFQFDFPQEAPLPTAAALSFSNLFPFFGFTGTYFEPGFLRELPAPLKVLSAAQTVLSLPLLFFLGLGLRTRFRMR